MKIFIACFLWAILLGFMTSSNAYVVGEVAPDSTSLITLENQPREYDIFNPPEIEVSMFADFSDSVVGDYMAVLWDRESLDDAQIRLDRQFPEIQQLNKYVFFMIAQRDKPLPYLPPLPNGYPDPDAPTTAISWGWKYARYVTESNNAECLLPDYYLGSNTSKAQLLGLVTQLDNLVSNGGDAGKVLRSVADLYGKVDEVKSELSVMRAIISDTE